MAPTFSAAAVVVVVVIFAVVVVVVVAVVVVPVSSSSSFSRSTFSAVGDKRRRHCLVARSGRNVKDFGVILGFSSQVIEISSKSINHRLLG